MNGTQQLLVSADNVHSPGGDTGTGQKIYYVKNDQNMVTIFAFLQDLCLPIALPVLVLIQYTSYRRQHIPFR